MAVHAYAPIDNDCAPCTVESSDEKRYPRVYFDVQPEQLKGLSPGDEVTIMIKGTLEGYRVDTEDTYGTGASLTVSMRQSEIKDTKEETFIDSLIDEG